MLKLNTKFILLLLSILSLILLSSCSYENTKINLGSGFDSTWTFSNSSDYEFDENLVEVVGGKAQLKVLDLEHSGDDFSIGAHVGTFLANKNRVALMKSNSGEFNALWTPKYDKIVGYWKMNNDLIDSSNNSAPGTSHGDLSYSNLSRVGSHSASFDGSGDYFSLPDSNFFDEDLSDGFTVSLWVRLNSISTQRLVTKACHDGSWVDSSYSLALSSTSTFAFGIYQGGENAVVVRSSSDPENLIESDRWYHVLATYNQSEMQLFVDGELSSSLPYNSGIYNGSLPLTIGARPNGSGCNGETQFLDGNLDEVAIWSDDLSAEEVAQIYSLQSKKFASDTSLSADWTPKWDNIVSYWKMDEDWQDSSGNGNHGVANGAINFDSSARVGYSAGLFDGVDDSITVSDDNTLDLTSALTISLWARPQAISGYIRHFRTLVSKDMHPNQSYGFYWDSQNDQLVFVYNSNSDRIIEPLPYGEYLNRWVHLAVTYDQQLGKIELFVDGSSLGIKSFTGSIIADGSDLTIGFDSDVSNDRYFKGLIDDVAIWNQGLSPSEILIIYSRQKQKYASHYDSEVIDLGSSSSTWPDLSWSTSLPFGKELVGDYDNDGNPDGESSSDYPELYGDISNGLLGYWNFNQMVTGAPNEIVDLSGRNVHGTASISDPVSSLDAKLSRSIHFDGYDGVVTGINSELNNIPALTISAWVKYDNFTSYDTIFSKGNILNVGNNRILLMSGTLAQNGSIWFVVENGTIPFIAETGPVIKLGEWMHISAVYDGAGVTDLDRLKIYINGKEEIVSINNVGVPSLTPSNIEPLIIGYERPGDGMLGRIDEPMIWSRALSSLEIQQLYRRGANRVKLQVKSCVDASCNCKSYGAGGSETDCDGDGTLNTADTDDTHKSEFIGPGGDGTTYYSELINRTNTEVTFNCALNITDSHAGVCAPDEITLTAGPKPTGPEFLNIDYAQFVTPPANRFAQYRVYMEADDNTACGGEPCLPELTSVSLNPTGAQRYSSEYIKVKPKSAITFIKLISAQIDAEPCATFRLSRSNTEYYFDGTSWVLATNDAHRNSASEVEGNITKFASDHGVGELEVNAYLASDASQSTQCSVNSVDVKYN